MKMNIIKRINQISAQLDYHPQSKQITSLNSSKQLISTNFSNSVSSIKLSASLIIIKPLDSITPDGFNYQTLLIQRNSSQRSFSSAFVFPGGHLDSDDHNLHPLIQKSTFQKNIDETSLLQDSLKICAIRETFEESGVLVGLNRAIHKPNASLQNFRQQLSTKLTKFSNILKQIPSDATDAEGQSKEFFRLDQLSHFANFLTPAVFPKRWDTHFYLTILPPPISNNSQNSPGDNLSGNLLDITYPATPDGVETVLSVWMSPMEALKRCVLEPSSHKDSITVAPPQFYLLRDLSEKKDYRELTHFQNRKVPPFTPEMVKFRDDLGVLNSFLTLPGDSMHSSSKNKIEDDTPLHGNSLKHRIYVQNEAEDFTNQPGKFFRPVRVQRSGMSTIFGTGWDDLN